MGGFERWFNRRPRYVRWAIIAGAAVALFAFYAGPAEWLLGRLDLAP
jgi:hypothetical protein